MSLVFFEHTDLQCGQVIAFLETCLKQKGHCFSDFPALASLITELGGIGKGLLDVGDFKLKMMSVKNLIGTNSHTTATEKCPPSQKQDSKGSKLKLVHKNSGLEVIGENNEIWEGEACFNQLHYS